jgi:hypothetical protein
VELTTILGNMPSFPVWTDYQTQGEAAYANSVLAWMLELIAYAGRVDEFSAELNGVLAEFSTNVAQVLSSVQAADEAKNLAAASANWIGEWTETKNCAGATVEWNGVMYISKIMPPADHIGDEPTPDNENYLSFGQMAIEQYLATVSNTIVRVNERYAGRAYDNGAKEIVTRTNGRISKVQYTNEDGVTVVRERTIIRDEKERYLRSVWSNIWA